MVRVPSGGVRTIVYTVPSSSRTVDKEERKTCVENHTGDSEEGSFTQEDGGVPRPLVPESRSTCPEGKRRHILSIPTPKIFYVTLVSDEESNPERILRSPFTVRETDL